jgi:hypothetical protein
MLSKQAQAGLVAHGTASHPFPTAEIKVAIHMATKPGVVLQMILGTVKE